MSLSRHVKDKNSPVGQFLRSRFSNTRPFLKEPRQRVRSTDTSRPEIDSGHPDVGSVPYPYDLIGMAIDYRIRYYFGVTPREGLAAYLGAWVLTHPSRLFLQAMSPPSPIISIVELPANVRSEFPAKVQVGFKQRSDGVAFFDRCSGEWLGAYYEAYSSPDGKLTALPEVSAPSSRMGAGGITADAIRLMGERLQELGIGAAKEEDLRLDRVYEEFFEHIDAFVGRCNPSARRLSRAEEDELNHCCIVLALLEEARRVGPSPRLRLFEKEHESLATLLQFPEANWVADMRNLSWRFYDEHCHLLSLPYSLNPTFDGSLGVGGADADMIVNGSLIDIKTTVQPKIDSDWIWQALGYALLDYSDHYGINGIGLHLARQGLLLEWSLEEAIRGLCPGEPSTIDDLRSEFEEVVTKFDERHSGLGMSLSS